MFSDVTYPALFVMTQRIRFCILGLDRHSIVAIYVEEPVCGSDGDLQVGLMTSPRLLMHVAPLMAPPRFPRSTSCRYPTGTGSRVVCTLEPVFGVKLMYDWPTMTPGR